MFQDSGTVAKHRLCGGADISRCRFSSAVVYGDMGMQREVVHILGVDVVRFRAGTAELIQSEAVLVGRRGWSQVHLIHLRF